MPYFSIYPEYVKEALLTRCTDGNKIIEWETADVPLKNQGPYIYFSWIAAHSTGTSKGPRNFDLYINDAFILTFTTYPKNYPPYWTFSGKDSSQLVFELKKKDGALDAHGIAYLRVPAKYEKGKPLKIKVVGQNQNSSDWYMTFKYTFGEKMDVESLPFLLKGKLKKQSLLFTVLHFGEPLNINFRIGNGPKQSRPVINGLNSFEIPVPAVTKASVVKIWASIKDLLEVNKEITVRPVTQRELYFVHHSHNDIGYSAIQEDVETLQNKNITDALHLIEATKNYPYSSRFTWNIESLWAVENFLRIATAKQTTDFIKAVQSKRLGLSGTYANILTGLCTPEEMNWITEYAGILKKKYKLQINSAMMTDIPGMSWSMVHSLASNGIRYFSNGPNYVEALPDKGDRIGATLKEWADKPFWWKSSSGKDSILFWTAGKGYSSWHGFTSGLIDDRGEKKIAGYLNELDAKNYPYTIVQWRYNIVSDNGPVDSNISDFIKRWNDKYESPKIILSNVSDMFEKFEKMYGHSIPVYRGDFTPYWEDGAYSTADEEGRTRQLSEKIIQLENAARQQNKTINSDWLYRAKRGIVMFHEHTWGSWNSISDPDNAFTTHQWEYKRRFLDSAQYFTDKIESSLFSQPKDPSSIIVVNTLPWPRSGLIECSRPALLKGNLILDEKGNKIPVQQTGEGKLAFIAIDVPANGTMKYHFSNGKNEMDTTFKSEFSFTTDSLSGTINHLQTGDQEWVLPSQFRGLGEPVYMKGLNPDSIFHPVLVNSEWTGNGPVMKRKRITAQLEGTRNVQMEITTFKDLDYLNISVLIDKKAIREKESMHIAFPFSISNPVVRIGMDDSLVTPEYGQIPGSNKDFYCVQRWLDVSGQHSGVTISSPQGSLFEVGKIINEERTNNGTKQWKTQSVSSSTVFLYALNNYWHTNYKADQGGNIRFDFTLKFHKKFNRLDAQRTGMEASQPLLVYFQ
jgi:hypothetical protein